MIKEGKQGKLVLDYISNDISNINKKDYISNFQFNGLCIKQKIIENNNEKYINICFIYPYNIIKLEQESCKKPYIETIGDRLQTYIVTFEDYQDFIMLIDEAYDILNELNNKKENNNE